MPLRHNNLAGTVSGIEPTTARNGIYARRAESANGKHLAVCPGARFHRNAPETPRRIAPKLHPAAAEPSPVTRCTFNQEEFVDVERTVNRQRYPRFIIHERVVMTRAARRSGLQGRSNGWATVLGQPTRMQVILRRDGIKARESYYAGFWRHAFMGEDAP